MDTKLLLECTMIAVFLLSVTTLGVMVWRRAYRDFSFVGAFLGAIALSQAIRVPVLFFRKYIGIDRMTAYRTLFYSGWVFFLVEYALVLLVIYTVFKLAMEPFEGLHRAGKLVFRWIASVSVVVSIGVGIGGHIGQSFWTTFDSQIHQAIGILALCLLLFVTFATRYLGLTYRSRIFGVSLGFGVWATSCLLESAALGSQGATASVYSPIYLYGSIGSCITIGIWGAYFAIPEPARQLITLPTTSPFFTWNSISEALGDDPGHVVVGGITPDMLAPGELHVLAAAARTTRARTEREATGATPRLQSIAAQG